MRLRPFPFLITSATVLIGGLSMAPPAHAISGLFEAILNGSNEVPPNASSGTGTAFVTLDDIAETMRVQVSFSGLIGTTTAAHIHAATAAPGTGTAGVATPTPTFPGFPLGVSSGSYDQTFDMTLPSSYNVAFVTNNGGNPASAEAALFAAIADGRAYLNIHTNAFPGGEIRGFFAPVAAVPGPLPLVGAGVALAWSRRLRRRVRSQAVPEISTEG
jgi:hypothetical protein